jgi:hypothetical protein
MPTAFKVTLLIMGILTSVLVYSIVYGSILCSIHHARATGLAVLYTDPLYWLLLLLIAEAWFGKRVVSN